MSQAYSEMSREHACGACGGQCRDERHETPCETPQCPACRDECVPCPVCFGAGRISDRMPVADALADAETLRINTSYQFDLPERVSFGKPPSFRASVLAKLALAAVPGLRGE